MKNFMKELWRSGDWMFALPISIGVFTLVLGAIEHVVWLLKPCLIF